MNHGVILLLAIAEVVAGVLLLAPALIGLSFLSETLRGASLPVLAHCLRWTAVAVAFAPLITAIVTMKKCWNEDPRKPVSAAILWTPVAAAALCVPAFFGLLRVVEDQAARAQRREARRALESGSTPTEGMNGK